MSTLRESSSNRISLAKRFGRSLTNRKLKSLRKSFADTIEELTSDIDNSLPVRGVYGLDYVASLLACCSIEESSPKLVLLWETHGSRSELNDRDRLTIEMVKNIFRKYRMKPQIHVLVADSHGAFDSVINYTYLRAISASFKEIIGDRVTVERLSDRYAAHTLSTHPQPVRINLSAYRHTALYRWIETEAHRPLERTLRYAALRMKEQKMLRKIIGDRGILLVFGNPLEQALLSELPGILFLRARNQNGYTECAPWEDAEDGDFGSVSEELPEFEIQAAV